MGLEDCPSENSAKSSFSGRLVGSVHRIPFPLKALDQALDPAGRQGIKGVGREPAIVGDLVLKLGTLVTHGSPLSSGGSATLSVIEKPRDEVDDNSNLPPYVRFLTLLNLIEGFTLSWALAAGHSDALPFRSIRMRCPALPPSSTT